MNKTKAIEILTALVNEGFNVGLTSVAAEDPDTDTNYNLVLQMPYGSTLTDIRPAQRVLDSHEATLTFPSFAIMLDEEIEEQRRREQESADALQRSLELADEAERERRDGSERAMASEKPGGRSGDFAVADDPPDDGDTA